MSVTIALARDQRKRPLKLRLQTRLAICCGRTLSRIKPHHLQRILVRVSRRAEPATVQQATAARESVLAASLGLHGLRACLPRSLSVAMLCRLQGVWPTWTVGVRSVPPFMAHAWIEVDRELIGEQGGYDSFSRLITVPPSRGHASEQPAVAEAPKD